MVIEINITTTSEIVINSDTDFWYSANQSVRLFGIVASILGFAGNYFSYITTFQLDPSNNVNLMKHLAFWDSVVLIEGGFFNFAPNIIGFNLAAINVSV